MGEAGGDLAGSSGSTAWLSGTDVDSFSSDITAESSASLSAKMSHRVFMGLASAAVLSGAAEEAGGNC